MSLIPIPKPQNYKEIINITEWYEFKFNISFSEGKALSDGLEVTNGYPPYIKDYRKGISWKEITLKNLKIKKEFHQHQRKILDHLDYEEKVYYRINLDFKFTIILRMGCPLQGYN